MNEEIRVVLLVGFLEIPVGLDLLEAAFFQQAPKIGLAQRKHVEMEHGPVRERIPEPGQRIVHVFGFGGHLVAAVIVGVFRTEAVVEDGIVIPLIDDQYPVIFERGVELGERPAPVSFVVQMGKEFPRHTIASYLPCTSLFSQRQSA